MWTVLLWEPTVANCGSTVLYSRDIVFRQVLCELGLCISQVSGWLPRTVFCAIADPFHKVFAEAALTSVSNDLLNLILELTIDRHW